MTLLHMCNAHNGENLQLLLFVAGSGPEVKQQLGVALTTFMSKFTLFSNHFW